MINFFENNCQETTDAIEFGIGDDPSSHAYLKLTDSDEWIAVVTNTAGKNITFTAIDNCIAILRNDGNMERSCDGMLSYEDNIVFVELKEVRSKWILSGIEQLKTTIEIFSINNDLTSYRRKRAFLANRKHPQFKYSHKEEMQRFRNETGVRLIIENQIIV